jgi:hypothetical protein
MVPGGSIALLFPFFATALIAAGCNPAIEIDVDCPRLCLAAPGPTLPGLGSLTPSGIDAAAYDLSAFDAGAEAALPETGISSGSVTWSAIMRFNDVLGQLPGAAVDLSLDVRLTTVNLASTTDLSFTDSIRVLLSRQENLDGGTGRQGGNPGTSACRIAGSSMLVATYDRQTDEPSGNAITLVNLVSDMNLFECMKDTPAIFWVTMAFRPGSYPALDAPLTLSTCVSATSHVSYP